MFLGVFLLHRWRKEVIFRIIIDHCLRQDLVIRIPLRRLKLFLHEGRYLIHIEINIRDISRFDIIDPSDTLHNTVQ